MTTDAGASHPAPEPVGGRALRLHAFPVAHPDPRCHSRDPRTGNQYNMVVQLDEPFRSRAEDLSRLFLIGEGGRPILLGNVAEIKPATGPVMIERKYQQRIVKISANPAGRDLGTFSEDLEERPRRIDAPQGLHAAQGETA